VTKKNWSVERYLEVTAGKFQISFFIEISDQIFVKKEERLISFCALFIFRAN